MIDSNFEENLELNRLADEPTYRASRHYITEKDDKRLYIGLIIGKESDIILDCKWSEKGFDQFHNELSNISHKILGLSISKIDDHFLKDLSPILAKTFLGAINYIPTDATIKI